MKIWKITLSIISSITLLSCEDERDPCGAVDPIPPTITFALVDSVTGKSLIGLDRLYHSETINKLNDTPPFFVFSASDTTLLYDFGQTNNGDQQILKLNRTERDTLTVDFRVIEGECHTVKSLDEFYYNDQLIVYQKGLFIIQK
jgi:hypothetical protein